MSIHSSFHTQSDENTSSSHTESNPTKIRSTNSTPRANNLSTMEAMECSHKSIKVPVIHSHREDDDLESKRRRGSLSRSDKTGSFYKKRYRLNRSLSGSRQVDQDSDDSLLLSRSENSAPQTKHFGEYSLTRSDSKTSRSSKESQPTSQYSLMRSNSNISTISKESQPTSQYSLAWNNSNFSNISKESQPTSQCSLTRSNSSISKESQPMSQYSLTRSNSNISKESQPESQYSLTLSNSKSSKAEEHAVRDKSQIDSSPRKPLRRYASMNTSTPSNKLLSPTIKMRSKSSSKSPRKPLKRLASTHTSTPSNQIMSPKSRNRIRSKSNTREHNSSNNSCGSNSSRDTSPRIPLRRLQSVHISNPSDQMMSPKSRTRIRSKSNTREHENAQRNGPTRTLKRHASMHTSTPSSQTKNTTSKCKSKSRSRSSSKNSSSKQKSDQASNPERSGSKPTATLKRIPSKSKQLKRSASKSIFDGSKRASWKSDPKESFSDWTLHVLYRNSSNKRCIDVYHLHRNAVGFGKRKSNYLLRDIMDYKLQDLFDTRNNSQEIVFDSTNKTEVEILEFLEPGKKNISLSRLKLSNESQARAVPMVLDYMYYTNEANQRMSADWSCNVYKVAQGLEVRALQSAIGEFYASNLSMRNLHEFVKAAVDAKADDLLEICKIKMRKMITANPDLAALIPTKFLNKVFDDSTCTKGNPLLQKIQDEKSTTRNVDYYFAQ